MQGNLTALLITAGIILTVVCIGFIAGSNKQSRKSVEEWSVGGRRFGGLLVWFLVGADLYTAYTFLGLTSTAFTSGSVAFFAIPYSVLAYFIAYFFCRRFGRLRKCTSSQRWPIMQGSASAASSCLRLLRLSAS